ncbi:MAG: ATP-binding protein [Desulfobacterales bacterium]|nr:ATP-binding protein [Desulfobacterales bacterium]
MTNKENRPKGAADLRQEAEALARKRTDRTLQDIAALSPEEIRETLHELRVHQIELEMQNEELRKAQAEIEESRARYFDLYDLAPVGYYTLSEKGLIQEANLTAAVLLDTARAALVKQPISRFILKEDQDIYYLHHKKLFETGESQECELRLLKPDGRFFWGHLTGTAAQAKDGAPVCHVVLIDITERKRAEQDREKLQAQLNQAQKMESVGRLAGGVAHDFNNKLTVINGYAEMAIGMMDPSDPLRETIREIYTAGKKSADIVRQLMAFARQQTINPVQLDLNDTISGMLKMLQRLIGENIELVWHPGNNLWPVKLDPSQADQTMTNLAVNARDAIADVGKIKIETNNVEVDENYCTLYPYFVPGQYVMLSVSDDGSGMDKETLANLFEPFFTTKEIGKGTGLGLAMIYGIVKQHNGFINVDSESGQGTTVKIYLPRHAAEEPALEPAKESTPTRQLPPGTETILIVEDEIPVLQMSRQILERLGYTVWTAGNPSAALQLSETYNGTIHLLITDVIMPEMNGRDLASQMAMSRPGLKILYMSGYTADVIAHKGVIDEGVQFIQKPFSMQELAIKVRKAIGPR